MNLKKSFIIFVICFLISIAIAYATLTWSVPTTCSDSDANCAVENINVSDSINETVSLKNSACIGNAACNVTATAFNGTVPDNAIVSNVTIHVKWSNDADGAGNQYVGFNNTTAWYDCAGPFDQSTNTYNDTNCTNLHNNFSTIASINNVQVRFRGNDTNGGAPAEARIDIMDVNVTYTLPTDTSFLVMMPSSYGTSCPSAEYCFNITATSEATANTTAWISFNITSWPASNVQPWRKGSSSDNQDGNGKPIFYIDNTGNIPVNISLRLNESFAAGITISANASCTGTYTACTSTKTQLTTGYIVLVNALSQTSSFANVSLWADVASGTAVGEYGKDVYINATNTTVP